MTPHFRVSTARDLGGIALILCPCEQMTMHCAMWDHVGSVGTIWDHLGPFGTMWDHVGSVGTIWDHLGPFGTNTILHLSSPVFSCNEVFFLRHTADHQGSRFDHPGLCASIHQGL